MEVVQDDYVVKPRLQIWHRLSVFSLPGPGGGNTGFDLVHAHGVGLVFFHMHASCMHATCFMFEFIFYVGC